MIAKIQDTQNMGGEGKAYRHCRRMYLMIPNLHIMDLSCRIILKSYQKRSCYRQGAVQNHLRMVRRVASLGLPWTYQSAITTCLQMHIIHTLKKHMIGLVAFPILRLAMMCHPISMLRLATCHPPMICREVIQISWPMMHPIDIQACPMIHIIASPIYHLICLVVIQTLYLMMVHMAILVCLTCHIAIQVCPKMHL